MNFTKTLVLAMCLSSCTLPVYAEVENTSKTTEKKQSTSKTFITSPKVIFTISVLALLITYIIHRRPDPSPPPPPAPLPAYAQFIAMPVRTPAPGPSVLPNIDVGLWNEYHPWNYWNKSNHSCDVCWRENGASVTENTVPVQENTCSICDGISHLCKECFDTCRLRNPMQCILCPNNRT